MRIFVSILALTLISCFPKPPDPVPPPTPTPDPEPEPPTRLCVKSSGISSSGPYQVRSATEGRVKIYEPITSGCKTPILIYNNGTGARCSIYARMNRYFASHGFLVACYESTNTGSGNQCISAIKTLKRKYSSKVTNMIAVSGHSQGGGAAHACHYKAEKEFPNDDVISVSHAPAHGMNFRSYTSAYPEIDGAVVMLSGSRDSIVRHSWVRRGYTRIRSEKYWYDYQGANHFNVYTRTQSAVVAFGTWKFAGNKDAENYFKGLPSTSNYRDMGR